MNNRLAFAENYQPTTPTQPPPQYATLPPPDMDGRPPQRKRRGEGLGNAISTVLILLMAPVVAIALTVFVFQSYQVDGPSMEPTLQNNDRLIVLKLPKTWAKITHHDYIPKRGDIIIFQESNLQAIDQSAPKQLVKRVIGLPGDRVVVKDGKITVFNSAHPNGFDPDTTLPYGQNAKVASSISLTSGNIDTTIAPGEVFVCGDNRTNSLDSRVFGAVPSKDIVGQLVLRIFPIGSAKRF